MANLSCELQLNFILSPKTIAVFGGIIYGILYVMGSVSEGVKSTKDNLSYISLSRRGLIRAMEASSFGTQGQNGSSSTNPSLSPPQLKQSISSSSSTGSTKRSLFSKKKHD
ncbi:hypothetical protein BT96DRAFT_918970 [Gymnopus androsaceus JB14]|uniref:Uncharacterized protein n=1 Tax=Gymnopus androsaceus JB14 TaxID=1447944 RepID=A0A6A4HTW6_9AGAR|nr:hypothetical protein BT96DRAFT_918970 [Gymnopus androsaceus JB14]